MRLALDRRLSSRREPRGGRRLTTTGNGSRRRRSRRGSGARKRRRLGTGGGRGRQAEAAGRDRGAGRRRLNRLAAATHLVELARVIRATAQHRGDRGDQSSLNETDHARWFCNGQTTFSDRDFPSSTYSLALVHSSVRSERIRTKIGAARSTRPGRVVAAR